MNILIAGGGIGGNHGEIVACEPRWRLRNSGMT